MANIAAVLAGLAVVLLLWPQETTAARGSGLRSVLASLQERLGSLLVRLLPSRLVSALAFDLDRSGLPLNLPSFALLWALSALALPLPALLMGDGGPLSRLLIVLSLAAGIAAPPYWLRLRIRHRRQAALSELPLFLDLLRVAVQAGQGIDAALAHVGRHLSGPLGEEVLRLLHRLRLGYDREEAYLTFARRLDLEEAHSLISAIMQAERTGGGLAPALASQASYLRGRLRQRAQEEARQAPIKMLLPMAFCLLPAMMVVLMGPAVLDLVQSLRGAR
ncbi:hypothetical protein HRbin24_00029 [bacterium HR24]|nr:type II secretion system F family protein [Chloroflexota bacterium]GBD12029.1 hypothetical protein HRbin24_00029 [bacterium HR24]